MRCEGEDVVPRPGTCPGWQGTEVRPGTCATCMHVLSVEPPGLYFWQEKNFLQDSLRAKKPQKIPSPLSRSLAF